MRSVTPNQRQTTARREQSPPGRCFFLWERGCGGYTYKGGTRISEPRAKPCRQQTIQKRLLQHPFQPFRICLSDGSTYEVRQAEMVLVLEREVIIALPKPGQEIARRAVSCDPLHITRIEPIDVASGPVDDA